MAERDVLLRFNSRIPVGLSHAEAVALLRGALELLCESQSEQWIAALFSQPGPVSAFVSVARALSKTSGNARGGTVFYELASLCYTWNVTWLELVSSR